jgi:hypothetical protein
MLIMKIGVLPDACRTHWNQASPRPVRLQNALEPAFTASERWIRGFTASGPLPDVLNPGVHDVPARSAHPAMLLMMPT